MTQYTELLNDTALTAAHLLETENFGFVEGELPPVEMYAGQEEADSNEHDLPAAPRPERKPFITEPALIELDLAEFYLALAPRLQPGMSEKEKHGAVFLTAQKDFRQHLYVVAQQLAAHMTREIEAEKAIKAERRRCELAQAAGQEVTENAKLIADCEKTVAAARQTTTGILGSMIAFKTLPASKALKAHGFNVRFDELAEIRKFVMNVYRQEGYDLARANPKLLHPAVTRGWADCGMDDITHPDTGYIALMKRMIGTAREVTPPSKLEQAEESIYENELAILSDHTAYLVKEMLAEAGCGCFANGEADREVSDEEMQVAEIRAITAILEDDRNFKTLSGKPRGRQHHFDRMRLVEMVKEELHKFLHSDVRKHSYRLGDGKGRALIQVPKIDDILTPEEAAYRRDYRDTLWVLEVRRTRGSKDWKVVEYGRAQILGEKFFAQDLIERAQQQYGLEARVSFERW